MMGGLKILRRSDLSNPEQSAHITQGSALHEDGEQDHEEHDIEDDMPALDPRKNRKCAKNNGKRAPKARPGDEQPCPFGNSAHGQSGKNGDRPGDENHE
jgi:hypothetical protein